MSLLILVSTYLNFYSWPAVVHKLFVPMRPDAPPRCSPFTPLFSSPILISLQLQCRDLPRPGPARFCSTLPLTPIRICSCLGVTVSSVAVNLHWAPISYGLDPTPCCLPLTLPAQAPLRLGYLSITVPLVVPGSRGGGGWGDIPVEDSTPWLYLPKGFWSCSYSSLILPPPPSPCSLYNYMCPTTLTTNGRVFFCLPNNLSRWLAQTVMASPSVSSILVWRRPLPPPLIRSWLNPVLKQCP